MSNKKELDTGLTLYEAQQKQYENVNPLDAFEVVNRFREIAEKIVESETKYFMLLCNELRDYTTVVISNSAEIDDIKQFLQEACQNRGDVLDIYDGVDGGWDIWIKDIISGKPHMRKLFDATDFVEII